MTMQDDAIPKHEPVTMPAPLLAALKTEALANDRASLALAVLAAEDDDGRDPRHTARVWLGCVEPLLAAAREGAAALADERGSAGSAYLAGYVEQVLVLAAAVAHEATIAAETASYERAQGGATPSADPAAARS